FETYSTAQRKYRDRARELGPQGQPGPANIEKVAVLTVYHRHAATFVQAEIPQPDRLLVRALHANHRGPTPARAFRQRADRTMGRRHGCRTTPALPPGDRHQLAIEG